MSQWYCRIHDQQTGPLELAEMRVLIKEGTLLPGDLVWREGLAQWAPVSATPELHEPGAPAPAVVVAEAPAAMPMASPVSELPVDQAVAQLLAPVASDVGPFSTVATAFRTPGGSWSGVVLASPLAFYLVKAGENMAAGDNMLRLFRFAFSSRIDMIRTCSVRELPDPVRKHLDPSGGVVEGDVIVLPKNAVSRINRSWINGRSTLLCGGDEFGFDKKMTAGRNKQFLLDNGWTLNTEMAPTIDPIHGERLGLPADTPAARRPLLRRVGFFVLAIGRVLARG